MKKLITKILLLSTLLFGVISCNNSSNIAFDPFDPKNFDSISLESESTDNGIILTLRMLPTDIIVEGWINVIERNSGIKFEGMDMNTLKEVADNLRDKLASGVVVLANVANDKLNLVVTATKDAVDKGVHCGNIVKSIAQVAGGKGGGRPNMAQAGAPDVSKVDEALNHASEVLKSQVK